jgi:hypothetical protein
MDNHVSILHRVILVTFILGMGALAASFYFVDRWDAYQLASSQVMQEKQKELDLFVDTISKIQRRPAAFMEVIPVPPQPPQLAETIIEIKDVKIKFTESSSWSTVFKILTTILGTFLGIKIINATFSWISRKSSPENR